MTQHARFDLVISGGLVSRGTELRPLDIGVKDGVIAAIADRLEDATRIVAAKGRLVLPGGIDSHCHMDQPSYGAECADDFSSGTLSAAYGGTTTVIPFAMAMPNDRLMDVVRDYKRKGEAKAYIDFGIHPTIQNTNLNRLASDLASLARQGFAALKVFTTYDGFELSDHGLLRVLDASALSGVRVMVHAENSAIIERQRRRLIAMGANAPKYHAVSRPVEAEAEAIYRLATFARSTGAKLTIVHVTSQVGLRLIRDASQEGVDIVAETCPQYLFCSEIDLDQELPEAAKFLCSPPLRSLDEQRALWRGIEAGDITLYSSDHSPYRLDGPGGKLKNGPNARFDQVANGMPGLELRLPLLFSEAYLTGRIDLPRFVYLASTAHAEFNGISHRKGQIALGLDADIVLWDTERETTITSSMLHDGTGFTPYEGKRIRGWPVTVISRGATVIDDGQLLTDPARGQFVASRWLPKQRSVEDSSELNRSTAETSIGLPHPATKIIQP